jgi:hypothetical protein
MFRGVLDRGRHSGTQIRLCIDDLVEPEARQSLDNQPQAAVGELEHLMDVRRRADWKQIVL